MTSQNPRKLVIFDCDGVLVNSEPIFNRVLHSYLRGCGVDISFSETCSRFTGKNRREVEAYFQAIGRTIPEDWPDAFYTKTLAALAAEVCAIDGVEAVLDILMEKGVAICVASNGLIKKMDVTLTRVGFLRRFQGAMFSAYDIGQSKPAPDVFQHAARQMGVKPEDCVVIEDSKSGFEAAQRADMRCFAYLPQGPLALERMFGAIAFRNMQDLPALLEL